MGNIEKIGKEKVTFAFLGRAVDAGDSMYIHAFGAYFGLAVSFVFGRKDKPKEHHLEGPSYQSDIFAMIALDGDSQQRAIINNLLSISGSCVIAFATSALISKDNKFSIVHVQNSTLAGGVAIGTAAGNYKTIRKHAFKHSILSYNIYRKWLDIHIIIQCSSLSHVLTSMMCKPIGALIIGSLASLLNVLGDKYLTVFDIYLLINDW
ncbi:hypothetical protein M0802_013132, partial [Mischocyttarus mexicanus]